MSKILYTDLFEYASDGAAQAVWVTDASGLELDYMEYANDGAAQTAYVSSAGAGYGSDVLTGGSASACGEDGVQYASLAVDGNTGTTWEHYAETVTHWWKYDLGEAVTKTVRKLRLYGNTYYTTLKDFKLQGSNNDSDWDDIHTDTMANTSNQWEDFTFANATAYRYYRLWITSHEGAQPPPASWKVAIYEVEMMELTSPALQSYSEDTIINQGTYSLKAIADITTSLNETLTKSGLSIDLSGVNTLKYDIYSASRTGSHIEIAIHDSGGTWTTHTANISSTDAWEEQTWDISGVADGNKDDIDEIRIKITNADVANTFYVDNFRTLKRLQCYSEDTEKQQGSYSLKILATTDALNKTLTKTIASDYLDYSVQDVIKFDIRASRTGSNIKLKIHDVGGYTQEHTVNIASANIWQTESWDISGISGTKRDQIDKIIIEIINATSANTIYIDNLYSKVVVEHSYTWVG